MHSVVLSAGWQSLAQQYMPSVIDGAPDCLLRNLCSIQKPRKMLRDREGGAVCNLLSAVPSAIVSSACHLVQVRTAWKVWKAWSNGSSETGLCFDDSVVQNQLAPRLVDREKV